jgi:hypothetical protein
MSGKYTPGPWKQYAPEIGGEVDQDYRTIQDEGCEPFRDGGMYLTGFVTEANARLIAAAPDLLEACERAVDACRDNLVAYQFKNEQALLTALQVCEAAIAKAKGESHE